jgi:hypothetical protein
LSPPICGGTFARFGHFSLPLALAGIQRCSLDIGFSGIPIQTLLRTDVSRKQRGFALRFHDDLPELLDHMIGVRERGSSKNRGPHTGSTSNTQSLRDTSSDLAVELVELGGKFCGLPLYDSRIVSCGTLDLRKLRCEEPFRFQQRFH